MSGRGDGGGRLQNGIDRGAVGGRERENSGASRKRRGDKWENKSSDGGEAAWGRYRRRGRCVCVGGEGGPWFFSTYEIL